MIVHGEWSETEKERKLHKKATPPAQNYKAMHFTKLLCFFIIIIPYIQLDFDLLLGSVKLAIQRLWSTCMHVTLAYILLIINLIPGKNKLWRIR